MQTELAETQEGRIAALERYEILDTPPERAFDDLARLAASICGVPIALVSLVDADRQWFKARVGLEVDQTSREDSFCSHAIEGPGLMIVPDAAEDPRFAANPLVAGEPGVRFYAGAPLVTPEGHALGTICVIDRRPRDLRPDQREALLALARLAVDQLELRRHGAALTRSERTLRASEERLSVMIASTTGGLWDWDCTTGEVAFSEGYAASLGGPIAPTHRAWLDRLHPEDRDRATAALDAHLGRLGPYDVEYRLRTEAGGYRWFRSRGQATWDRAGRPARMGGTIEDITDRKRSEQELRTLKAALDNANDAILITEAEPVEQPGPRVIYVNKAFTRNTGFAPADILGKTPRILHGPDTDRATLDELKRRLVTWRPVRVELLNYKKDGTQFWVELNIRPVADERGWYTHWVSVQRDVTARRRAEAARLERSDEALRESRERLRTVVTGAPVILFALDREGVVTLSEGRGLAPLGWEPGQAVGRSALGPEPIPPLTPEAVRRALAGESFGTTVEVSGLAFDTRYSPLMDKDGELAGAIGVATDVTERKRSEREIRALNDQLASRLDRMAALRRVDRTISASLDLRVTLDTLLDQATAQLRVPAAAVYLLDPHAGALEVAASRGLGGSAPARLRPEPGSGPAGRAAKGQATLANRRLGESAERLAILAEEGFAATFAAPLVAKGRVLGVLEVFLAERAGPDAEPEPEPDPEWVDFLEDLAGQAAIAVDSAEVFRELQRSNAELTQAYDATIEGWSRALDLRDRETEGHTRRVTEMAVRLARDLGIGGSDLVNVRRGALLHDIGKMGIPDAILLKPGKLTDEEWTVMRRHPGYAHEWLSPIGFLRPSLEIPRFHHERWDGTGYPRGLAGEEIPLAARAFAAVDIWDALRSDRPYREGWPEARVVEHIRSLAGSHLDPEVVAAFLRILDEDDPLAAPPADFRGPAEAEARLRRAAADVLRLEAAMGELARANSLLAELSTTDDLTGLRNRRHFREALEAAFTPPGRRGRVLSVILLDVDHFKSFNDAHGHRAGDDVLRSIAAILRDLTRSHDLAARHGGEEFAVLMPGADPSTASAVASRLRAAIAEHHWPLRQVTASFGVATSTAETPGAVELLERADRALYRSKHLGRDRVSHAEEEGLAVAGLRC